MEFPNGTESRSAMTDSEETVIRPDSFSHRAKYLTQHDLLLRKESDPILDVLPRSLHEDYLQVRKEVRQGFVKGLQSTLRWQNLVWNDEPRPVNPDFRENDLDHVIGLIEWCNLIESNYPALYEEISGGNRALWHELLTMLVVHDAGEIKLGDVALTNQGTREGMRKKKIEPRWARYSMHKNLSLEQSTRIIPIYNRFEVPDENDKIALTAKFLDKAQASGHVARDIIAYNLDKADYVQFEFRNNLPQTLRPAAQLLDLCQSEEAAMELQAFVQEHVMDYFDALKFADIESLRGEIRDKFPTVFSHVKS